MKVIILGAAGFIGSNLAIALSKRSDIDLTLVDRSNKYFDRVRSYLPNVRIVENDLASKKSFDQILRGQEVVFHLLSSTVPTTSNTHISSELRSNVVLTSELLESCVNNSVNKIVFMSSGGTVYGKVDECPISENAETNPINSYGVQKLTIEKLLYLYNYLYNLDYKIVRMANPYGPFQRPNGVLGAVTTFVYQTLKQENINVYGSGDVVRDFIYIDDAIRATVNIALSNHNGHTYNVGSGYGTSINQVLSAIQDTLKINMKVTHFPGRKADVPVNYLDIRKYESQFGKLNPIGLSQGIIKTAKFLQGEYDI